jgi:hypothetical protein
VKDVADHTKRSTISLTAQDAVLRYVSLVFGSMLIVKPVAMGGQRKNYVTQLIRMAMTSPQIDVGWQ